MTPRFSKLRLLRDAGVLCGLAVVLGATSSAPSAQTVIPDSVTFAKDVAPILQARCQSCHRPGQIGPMSLLTYEEARPWARSIKQNVSTRQMPPWFVDKTIGIQKFKDDESLSDAEIATIAKWVDAGAPLGNPADLPTPRVFDDGSKWHLGEPDLIVKSKVVKIPARGAEQNYDIVVDSGLTEDRWIQAIETKPSVSGFKAIHHLLATAISPSDDVPDQYLSEYSAGKNADQFLDGTAKAIMAGAKIKFSYHIHPVGEELTDQSELAIKFYPRGYKPARIAYSEPMGGSNGARIGQDIDIAPGAISRHDGYSRLALPGKITAFQPHLHSRGKRQCIELIYPDDTQEVLNCADFRFGWARVYVYADDVAPIYPAGTIMHVISWHDNTTGGRYSIDPRNWVGLGSRTVDEMSFSWISWYDLSPEEYRDELTKREQARARAKRSTNDQQ